MKSFKCKICSIDKPLEDSVSLHTKICCTCFTSIQIHKRVEDKTEFYTKTLMDQNKMTPIRRNKIESLKEMNNIFSFYRNDLLQLNMGDVDYVIQSFITKSKIKSLKQTGGKYFLKDIDMNKENLLQMRKNHQIYQKKIISANNIKNKFQRFLNIIAKNSQFIVLKDTLMKVLVDYINEERFNHFEGLKSSIFEGISRIYEPDLLPNIALYFYYNYDRIFSTLMTEVFPYDKERISFDYPTVNSRTDFGLKVFYRYNSSDIRLIKKAKNNYDVSWDEPHISRFLFINCIKTITEILDGVFQYYYDKLKIKSPVQSIVNILGSSQNSTKLYDEVTYYLALREW